MPVVVPLVSAVVRVMVMTLAPVHTLLVKDLSVPALIEIIEVRHGAFPYILSIMRIIDKVEVTKMQESWTWESIISFLLSVASCSCMSARHGKRAASTQTHEPFPAPPCFGDTLIGWTDIELLSPKALPG